MKAYDAFSSSVGEIQLIADHANELLQAARGEGRVLANALTRSGLVLLSGSFEGFLREIVIEYIDEVCDRRLAFSDLPSGFVCSAAERILQLNKSKRFEEVRAAAKAITTGSEFEFGYKKMATTGGNPTVDIVEDLFTGLGHPNVIDVLSIKHFGLASTYSDEKRSDLVKRKVLSALEGMENSDAAIADVLDAIDEAWTPRKKRRDVGYVSAIQELLKKRNRIAHGEGGQEITPAELAGHIEGISKLADGLSSILDESLSQIDEAIAVDQGVE